MGAQDGDKQAPALVENDQRSSAAVTKNEQAPRAFTILGFTFKFTFTRGQVWGGLVLLISYVFFLYQALCDADNMRHALGWLVAATLISQIYIDLSNFSSAESKGRFTATFRAISGGIALLVLFST